MRSVYELLRLPKNLAAAYREYYSYLVPLGMSREAVGIVYLMSPIPRGTEREGVRKTPGRNGAGFHSADSRTTGMCL